MKTNAARASLLFTFSLLASCGPAVSTDRPVDPDVEVGADEIRTPVPVGSELKTTAAINFRTGPGLTFQIISVLPRGAIVEAVQSNPTNGYYNVRFQGTVGWASGTYLTLVASSPDGGTPPPVTGGSGGKDPTGGSGGALTNVTFQSFSNGQYTSRYHLYASGLDWSKPVGLIVYGDGSGEFGLKNPGSTYLLAGTNGLIAVAKRNNMVLLTPFAPNPACSDGGGSCWYQGDPPGYAKWSADLVKLVESRYNLDKSRVVLGGYSSGAQWLTEYFCPGGHAGAIMSDGVAVAISYGGSPKVTATFSAAFKGSVHFNWNTGSTDPAYTTTSAYGVKAGYNWYSGNGFQTSLDVISGLGHSRSDFGRVIEAQITEHILN